MNFLNKISSFLSSFCISYSYTIGISASIKQFFCCVLKFLVFLKFKTIYIRYALFIGQQKFVDSLELQYGHEHVKFFAPGSYEDAVIAAENEGKFVLIYLHSGDHAKSQQFCQ
jgi:hypothetical protein